MGGGAFLAGLGGQGGVSWFHSAVLLFGQPGVENPLAKAKYHGLGFKVLV